MRVSRCCWCLVFLVVVAATVCGRVSIAADDKPKQPTGVPVASADGGTMYARPSADALAKALAKVREVYKDDLAKANQPGEKALLAKRLLKTADDVGGDDANRLALLKTAADLAVQAHDVGLAMQAVKASVARFQPDGPADPKEQVERGNALWKEAEAAMADKRLGLQIQAAEWYLHANPAATGFDKTIIEKRLGQLGTAASSVPALAPEKGSNYLADLEPHDIRVLQDRATGPAEKYLRSPVKLDGVVQQHGIYLYPPRSNDAAHVSYTLNKQYRELTGRVGPRTKPSDRQAVNTHFTLRIIGDGKTLWSSKPFKQHSNSQPFQVDVTGVRELQILLDCPGQQWGAVLADPLLRYTARGRK